MDLSTVKQTPTGIHRHLTDIDRRNCKRIVPMEVLVLGLGRTGTASIRQALMILGYDDTYHMHETFFENPRDCDLWEEALEAKFEGKGKPRTKAQFDALLGHCMAVTDYPPVSFSEELIEYYPDAKIVLSVRDSVEAWHASVMDTIGHSTFIFEEPKTYFQAFMQRIVNRPPIAGILRLMIKHTWFGDSANQGKAAYLEHNARIRALAPPDQFLEFNVKQGWEPLCKFLGKEVPSVPFPRVNDTQAWKDAVEGGRGLAPWFKRTVMGVLAVGVAGVAWFVMA